jgi:hypothetical protein
MWHGFLAFVLMAILAACGTAGGHHTKPAPLPAKLSQIPAQPTTPPAKCGQTMLPYEKSKVVSDFLKAWSLISETQMSSIPAARKVICGKGNCRPGRPVLVQEPQGGYHILQVHVVMLLADGRIMVLPRVIDAGREYQCPSTWLGSVAMRSTPGNPDVTLSARIKLELTRPLVEGVDDDGNACKVGQPGCSQGCASGDHTEFVFVIDPTDGRVMYRRCTTPPSE